jgi:hypothetical protein
VWRHAIDDELAIRLDAPLGPHALAVAPALYAAAASMMSIRCPSIDDQKP